MNTSSRCRRGLAAVGFTWPDVNVGPVLPRGPRPALIAAVTAVVAAAVCSGCTSGSPSGNGSSQASMITSTTQIAGAGVLGNERRPDESCAPEPAGLDAPASPRIAHNAAGAEPDTVDVPDDPQRIVVLSGDQLDALCALGLQTRIVGSALPDGSPDQPSYLGTVLHKLPGVGTRSNPDLGAIKAAKPDLILGSQALTPKLYGNLAAIAPTVFTGAPGAAWQNNLRGVAEATARAEAATDLIEHFTTKAHDDGAAHDSAHYQASVVQFTENAVRIYGTDNFPGSVLTTTGVDRPAAQRFTDKAYVEVGSTDNDLANANFSAADADVVYVSFDSSAAKDRAPTIFDSDAWRRLSATHDNRIFVVNNEVWQTGEGVVAARGIIDDLRWVNAPIN